MSTRRDLTLGRRAVLTLLAALPISLLASVALALVPFLSRDAGVSVGYYAWPLVFAGVVMALFVSERPLRQGIAWIALSGVACAAFALL